jgi:hypothetical protein
LKKDPRAIDEEIRKQLKIYSDLDKDYWSFKTGITRNCMHACFQYPGMMVPQMQERLISIILNVKPSVKSVYEPFVGSGTTMIETMKRGLDFTGQDINPLAVLLCRAKSGPFHEEAIRIRTKQLLDSVKFDRKTRIEANFPGLNKWFKDDVARELSKIRRAIRKERYLWCRRFYWMSLAETVRLTCNARNTTFKLHVRPKEEIKIRDVSPIKIFFTLLQKNLSELSLQKKLLQESRMLYRGIYIGNVEIRLADSTTKNDNNGNPKPHDLLITSPPYGDNKSTVSYGQYSYLPLKWIDLEDIDSELDESWLSTAYEIDRRSLGGSLQGATDAIPELLDKSISLKRTFQSLKNEPRDRQLRVAAFWRDLSYCIEPTLAALKQNAYMLWVVGNRSVAGRQIPMDKILLELLNPNGVELVDRVQRTIPKKRMATKNNISPTMRSETILVMRKHSN